MSDPLQGRAAVTFLNRGLRAKPLKKGHSITSLQDDDFGANEFGALLVERIRGGFF